MKGSLLKGSVNVRASGCLVVDHISLIKPLLSVKHELWISPQQDYTNVCEPVAHFHSNSMNLPCIHAQHIVSDVLSLVFLCAVGNEGISHETVSLIVSRILFIFPLQSHANAKFACRTEIGCSQLTFW